MSRQQPNLDLYNDLCVVIEQALWETEVLDSDRTVAYVSEDGVPRWGAPEPVIAAIASRCVTVFAVHGVTAPARRVAKDGSTRK